MHEDPSTNEIQVIEDEVTEERKDAMEDSPAPSTPDLPIVATASSSGDLGDEWAFTSSSMEPIASAEDQNTARNACPRENDELLSS